MALRGSNGKRERKNRLPRYRRTIPVFGLDDDAGRYFRCWNCGFVCDKERDALDDGPVGIVFSEATITPYPTVGDEMSVELALGEGFVLPIAGLDGSMQDVYSEKSTSASSGCPQCGIHTYR